MKYFHFILGMTLPFLPTVSWSQIPDFQELDIDSDGKITEEEYEQYDFGLEEAENEPMKEENVDVEGSSQAENTKSISDYIGIQKRFLSGDGAFFGRGGSLLGTGTADPGRFNYTFSSGDDVFTTDLAVIFRFLSIDDELSDPQDKWIRSLYALPVFEAHVSSNENTENSLQFQFPFLFSFTKNVAADVLNNPDNNDVPKSSFISSHHLIGSPLYQTDRELETSIIGLDLLYSPGIPSLGIGSPIRIEEKSRFRWRPLVGFEFGQVLDDGGNEDALPQDTFVRATARIRAELLIIDQLTFSADYVWRFDLNGDNDFRDYIDLTTTYFLDESEKVSIGLTYKNGENTPQFVDVDEFSTFLGFKF